MASQLIQLDNRKETQMMSGTFLLWAEVFSTQGVQSAPVKTRCALGVQNTGHPGRTSNTQYAYCLNKTPGKRRHSLQKPPPVWSGPLGAFTLKLFGSFLSNPGVFRRIVCLGWGGVKAHLNPGAAQTTELWSAWKHGARFTSKCTRVRFTIGENAIRPKSRKWTQKTASQMITSNPLLIMTIPPLSSV